MNVLYGLATAAGFVALLVWAVARATSARIEFFDRLPPYAAVTLAFGLAGLSASYAGWPTLASAAAAVLAGVASFLWVRGTRTARKS